MLKPCPNILDPEREKVFSQLPRLPKGGILGGGTALALQIGHRRSYDFDIFYQKHIPKAWLRRIRTLFGSRLARPVVDTPDELTVILRPDIKLTLLSYPFPHLHAPVRIGPVRSFDIRDIASSKAYAVGRRGTWRDYVDLYFMLKEHVSLDTIIRESTIRFSGVFDAKMFLQQLVYFKDIQDMTVEPTGARTSQAAIKRFLSDAVKQYVERRVLNP